MRCAARNLRLTPAVVPLMFGLLLFLAAGAAKSGVVSAGGSRAEGGGWRR